MLDLYKEDEEKIYDIVDRVRAKHMDGGEVNWDKLGRLHRELEGRLQDAGYDVSVDVTPLLEGFPPIVNINGRRDAGEWDFDKKAYEVKKRIERNEGDPQIEGMV